MNEWAIAFILLCVGLFAYGAAGMLSAWIRRRK